MRVTKGEQYGNHSGYGAYYRQHPHPSGHQRLRNLLERPGRSPYTVKAFLSDLRLMASYFPPDRTLGAITTADLNASLRVDAERTRRAVQPQDPGAAHYHHQILLPLVEQERRAGAGPAEKVVQRSVISPCPPC